MKAKTRRAGARASKGMSIRSQDRLAGSLFFLPWVIGFLAITCYPLIYSVLISFNQVVIKPGSLTLEPVGFEYFRQALLADERFPLTLLNSVSSILLGMPLTVVFSLIIALLLSRKFRGRAFYRVIFFLPVVIMSGPVMTQLMSQTSAMNVTIDFMNIRSILMEMSWTGASILITFLNSFIRILWFCGVQIIIFLVALQKINPNMYEAASIDGATAWESFWKITLPYLKPVIMLNCVYTVVEMGAAADDATNQLIAGNIRDIARPYSYAAAQSWLYAGCLLLIILVAFLLFREKKEKEA
ncbi:MAG TPA: sugar ABC transporter permease [Feifaniaceae bacterium]|nr:sugar ABC transporter permease [Feifaniaceae bacterium]